MSDIADRYDRLADLLARTAGAVPPDRWHRPSPCEGWTAREVLAHVATSQWDLLKRLGHLPDGVDLPEDPRAALATARDSVRAVLDDPARADKVFDGYFGPTTFAATVDRFYSSDMVVHRWDIARATGLADHEAMPPEEVERLRVDYREMGDELRQPGICGPAVDLPPGADAQSQLLAFLGRHP